MPSDVTLQLNDPSAWTKRLTLNQSKPAGTAYDGIMLSNYSNRAATSAAIPTFGLDATISFSSGYQVYVAAFDSDLNYLGYNESGSSRGWKNPPYTFSSASAEYICIAVKSLPEAEFTDAMFEDMSMSVTLAGGGGSMTDAYSREEAYELNEIAGWEEFAYGPTANPTTAKFRNAGSGNGRRIWGLSEDGLPMGATGYMSIDTSAETCTNSDNTISQDSVPLVVGEVYTIGAFVRGKGYFTCGPTQDGYYRARSEHVDHPNWRFYGGVFTAKSTSQNMYWRNETIATSEYAGKLDISAPILVRGGVASVILATDTKTLAVTVDVQKVETYYYQTASTASAPTKPTTATPSGWQTTEFAFDASKAVWTCQKTTLSDGTFRWGEVSKWSAYEGAVVSKNAADAAQSTANSANAREQRIYRSAASGTTSMAATETWVASTADAQNAWTAKRPSYDRSYPVLFTATQRQTVAQQAAGSTCSCTTPYVDESAAVAGNYITKVGTGGDAWIHSEGHGPDSSGNATASTYGWRIGSVFELVRAGLSYFKMWVDNNVAKVRVGLESAGHSIFSPEGMEVFTDASTNVAQFGETSRIGLMNGMHAEINSYGMQLFDAFGNTYYSVGYLLDSNGYTVISQSFYGDGSTTQFTVGYRIIDVLKATVNGSNVGVASSNLFTVTLSSPPGNYSKVIITYRTDAARLKSYTFGTRFDGEPVGEWSITEGESNTAEGMYSKASGYANISRGYSSFSEGCRTRAYGDYSHAQNQSTYAEGESQTAIGRYNVSDARGLYALIIGNGIGDSYADRSNAATVAWDGNYIGQAMAGIVQMFAGAVTQTVTIGGDATVTGAPAGWLLCNGAAVSRTTYATLFAAIGTTWGAGNGTTTFNLPDLRGRAPIGAGTGSGLTARTLGTQNIGAETHSHNSGKTGSTTLTAAQSGLPAHTHGFTQPTLTTKLANIRATGNLGMPWYSSGGGTRTDVTTASGGAVGAVTGGAKAATSGHDHSIADGANMQPSAVVNFIICTGKTS